MCEQFHDLYEIDSLANAEKYDVSLKYMLGWEPCTGLEGMTVRGWHVSGLLIRHTQPLQKLYFIMWNAQCASVLAREFLTIQLRLIEFTRCMSLLNTF